MAGTSPAMTEVVWLVCLILGQVSAAFKAVFLSLTAPKAKL
jgi:hypothetical protein